ncbi:MAG: hypothetical protein QME96_17600 [Myxococcota bacterium]|nr:hypothetical protein [Myxococcota bacterium]
MKPAATQPSDEKMKWDDLFPDWRPCPWQDDPSRLDEAFQGATSVWRQRATFDLGIDSGLPDSADAVHPDNIPPPDDGLPD